MTLTSWVSLGGRLPLWTHGSVASRPSCLPYLATSTASAATPCILRAHAGSDSQLSPSGGILSAYFRGPSGFAAAYHAVLNSPSMSSWNRSGRVIMSAMFKLEWARSGASARFWAYVM